MAQEKKRKRGEKRYEKNGKEHEAKLGTTNPVATGRSRRVCGKLPAPI
jgi:hypothetical protein